MAGLGVVALLGGCARTPAPALQSGGARGANLLLVTVDTLRRDRVGAYGSPGRLTPAIDRLAAGGVRFTRAFAHAPMTLPSHASILTGRTPLEHGLRNNGTYRLDDRVPTLATALHDAGYRTGAFVGAFVLDARYGLNRGFDRYDDRMGAARRRATFHLAERPGAAVVHAASEWLAADATRPWFAWVHLFDPHAPYAPPAEFAAGRTPYDGEVSYADAMIARLLERATPPGAERQTLVVVTSDHGESLGEHGESTHGLFAYDATIAVPLVLHGPGVAPSVVDGLVGHADILPTVLDLLAVPELAGVTGRALARPPDRDRAIYFEAMDAFLTRGWAPLTGIVTARWKLIDLPARELYDREADAAESTNLASREVGTADALERRRRGFVQAPATAAPAAPRDADADRRLRALGYTAGVAAAGAARRPAAPVAPDPKTLVDAHERFTAALEAFSAGRTDEALAALRALLVARPDFTAARVSAATVLLAAGRAQEAIVLLREAPETDRDAPEVLAKLGAAYRDAGALEAARTALESARASGWHNAEVLNDLGVVEARLGRADAARAAFAQLTAESPGAADAWNNLGVLELSTGRRAAAAAAFRRAVDADASFGDAWQGLGAALAPDDPVAAAEAWRRAERLLPQDLDLLYNLGVLLASGTRPAEAEPYLARFLREAPRSRGRDRAVVQTLLRQVQP